MRLRTAPFRFNYCINLYHTNKSILTYTHTSIYIYVYIPMLIHSLLWFPYIIHLFITHARLYAIHLYLHGSFIPAFLIALRSFSAFVRLFSWKSSFLHHTTSRCAYPFYAIVLYQRPLFRCACNTRYYNIHASHTHTHAFKFNIELCFLIQWCF